MVQRSMPARHCAVRSLAPRFLASDALPSGMAEQSTLPRAPCTGARFDSQISVFAGDPCGQLTCIDGNNDVCCSQSLVVIQSNQDHACHVLAHGFGGVSGNFALQIIPTRLVGLSGLLANCKCSIQASCKTFPRCNTQLGRCGNQLTGLLPLQLGTLGSLTALFLRGN
jgi:hypothetical protein